MATLHVRSVPDELYERLRERAAAERRSLSAEVIALLERGLETPAGWPASRRAAVDRLAGLRRDLAADGISVDVAALVREDRDAR
jgi:plasmid stability protein